MLLNLQITYNDRGQLKCPFISSLNNINQDIKKISEVFTLDTTNGFITYGKNRKGIVGKHMSRVTSEKDIKVIQEAFGSALLEINADAFYALLKEYKKNMVAMTLYNDTDKLIVTLDNGTAIQIGRYIIGEAEIPVKTSMLDDYRFHSPVTQHKDRFTVLNDEQVERISESILKCMMNDIHIRITKQLVPGISTKFNIAIFLDIERLEVEGNAEICRLYILQERKTVDHFHIYKVLKY